MPQKKKKKKSQPIPETVWSWDLAEQEYLNARYKTGLLRALRALEEARAGGADLPTSFLSKLAKEFDQAGDILDHCASNCHAMSATCCAYAEKPPMRVVSDEDAVRLRSAINEPVVMTRTTIEQLRDKIMSLEDLNGPNGIVQFGGEYWGTPVDRLLVLQPGSSDVAEMLASADETAEARDGASMIHVSTEARAFINGYMSGNVATAMVVQSAASPGVVRLQSASAGINEFVPLEALPPEIQIDLAEPGNPNAETSDQTGDFHFRLREGELSNAIQFLTMAGREGILDVHFPDFEGEHDGRIFVMNGRVSHIELGATEGVKALAIMLRAKEATGIFRDEKVNGKQTIKLSPDQLLIEAAVMADENGE